MKKEMKWNERDRWSGQEMNEKKKWTGNGIGSEGTKSLSEALKINTSLASLNLEGDENEMKWKKIEEIEINENERNEMNREQNRRWRS